MAKISSSRCRVAVLQLNSGADWRKNLSRAQKLISKALRYHPDIIATPENFLWRGPGKDISRVILESYDFSLNFFSDLAKKNHTAFLLGSLLEKAEDGKRCYNTSILIDKRGRLAAKYRKIHLFDANLKDVRVKESKRVKAGEKVVTVNSDGFRTGLSICYDLRFPELYRKLAEKCEILFIPSNFTQKTGQAHWEVLIRARAIENLAYVIAPGQVGANPSTGIASFGHSLIVDPWGKILNEGSSHREEVLCADLDLHYLRQIRRIFPVLTHRKLT